MVVKTEERVELFIHRDIIRSKINENDITGRKAGTEGVLPATGTWFDCSSPRGTLLTRALATSSLETMKTKQNSEKSWKSIFYTIFPSCWGVISKPPGDICPLPWSSVRDSQRHAARLFCAHLGGDWLWWERSWRSKITTAIQCIIRWAEISSHHGCIFQTANCPLVISPGNCIPHRIPSIHRTLLSLRGGYFNSSVMSVATRKQEEIEYEVHFS